MLLSAVLALMVTAGDGVPAAVVGVCVGSGVVPTRFGTWTT
jgi:hypothetical protein